MSSEARVAAVFAAPAAVVGEDGVPRCPWAYGSVMEREYHDTEWGTVLAGEQAWFERLTLEAFQSGLSWRTILAKRPAFRELFAGFDVDAVAEFTPAAEDELMLDARIVRNRAKIRATVVNAQATVALREYGGLETFLLAHRPALMAPQTMTVSPESTALSKALKKRGFTFVGPTTMQALMEAGGLFDPHLDDCFRRGAAGVGTAGLTAPERG